MVREIELTQGKVALVDDEDWEYLSSVKWCLSNRYAASAQGPDREGSKRFTTMHRLLMGSPEDMDVHHKNGDSLDNRRDNLEIITHSEHRKLHPKGSPWASSDMIKVRVTPQMREAVETLAEKFGGVPMCQIVRWAIAEYVEREEREANDGIPE